MIKYYTSLIFSVLFVFNINGWSQRKLSDTEKFGCFPDSNEKVFAQLDKDVYVSGESLQYKAWLVNASSHMQKSKSKVLYFKLINSERKVVQSWRTNVEKGMGFGKIGLPDSLSSGIYDLFVYTNWMRNTSTHFYCKKSIVVARVNEKDFDEFSYLSLKEDGEKVIDFFPEGGQLVEGLESRIGFQLHNPWIDTNRYVTILENGNEIRSIKVDKEGRGEFFLTPVSGSVYTSIVKLRNKEINSSLPGIKSAGYTMFIKSKNEFLHVSLNSKNIYNPQNKQILIFCRGKKVYSQKRDLTNNSISIDIPYSALPKGILYIVAVDDNNYLLTERLYYNALDKQEDKIVNIQFDTAEVVAGKKLKIKLSVNEIMKNDTAFLSAQITEVTPFEFENESVNIDDYLYLFSEIGNQTPFDVNSVHKKELDLMMLTTSQENYAWSLSHADISRKCSFMQEEYGFLLSGKALEPGTQKPVENKIIILSVTDSVCSVRYAYTNESGSFHFLLNKQYDNRNLILQLENTSLHKPEISWIIDDKEIDLSIYHQFSYKLDADKNEFLDEKRKQYLINSIFYELTNGNHSKAGMVQGNFYGNADYVVYPSDFVHLKNFTEIAENILPAVRFKNKDGAYFIQQFNPDTKISYPIRKTVFLNGVQFADLDYIAGLSSKDIKRIEISRNHLFYGDLTYYGIVSIYTYDGFLPEDYLKKNSFLYNNRVLMPDFNHKKQYIDNVEHSPDIRSVLYWNPEIVMISHEEEDISFTTSEMVGTYKLIVQGITKSGSPVHEELVFKIKK